MKAIEEQYEATYSRTQQAYKEAQEQSEDKAGRYGSNLGWFTVMALLVLVACIGIEETYHKGCGIREVSVVSPYAYTMSVWSKFVEACSLSWEYTARAWIARSFPARLDTAPVTEVVETVVEATAQPIEQPTAQPTERHCEYCSQPYERRRKDQRFCSKACRLAYHSVKHNGKVFLPATWHKWHAMGS